MPTLTQHAPYKFEGAEEMAVMKRGLNVAVERGDWMSAIGVADKIVNKAAEVYGKRHVSYACAVQDKGVVQKIGGQYQDALKSFDEALQVYLEVDPLPATSVATVHTNRAATLRILANQTKDPAKRAKALDEVIDTLRRAVEVQKNAVGEEHQFTAAALRLLGNTLKDVGKLEEAEQLLEQALKIYTQDHIRPSFPVAAMGTRNDLSIVVRKRSKDFIKAVKLLEGAIDEAEKHFGEEPNKEVLLYHFNMAELLEENGQIELAGVFRERVVELGQKFRLPMPGQDAPSASPPPPPGGQASPAIPHDAHGQGVEVQVEEDGGRCRGGCWFGCRFGCRIPWQTAWSRWVRRRLSRRAQQGLVIHASDLRIRPHNGTTGD